MNIFEYLNYRMALKKLTSEWKKREPNGTLGSLAEAARIQPPYLTNVLKERAHLNTDQLFLICKAMGLSEDESHYLQLLLEADRTGLAERKKKLIEQIEEIQKQQLKTNTRLKAKTIEVTDDSFNRYYLNPDLQLIYAFLGVERFKNNLKLIAENLGLEREDLDKCIQELIQLGFLKSSSAGLEKVHPRIHLGSDSPVTKAQQQLLKMRGAQQLLRAPAERRYSFLVNFTADEPTREFIQREFIRYLQAVEERVGSAESQHVYQMSFDLFPWSK